MSKYRYFIRNSSPPSVWSSMVNGGTLEGFNMSKSDTLISISPVGIFLFLELRSITVPLTLITNSLPSFLACLHRLMFSSMLNASCVIPYLSLRSTKVIPPRSLFFCTQPLSITSSPTLFMFNSPQVLVLNILFFVFRLQKYKIATLYLQNGNKSFHRRIFYDGSFKRSGKSDVYR